MATATTTDEELLIISDDDISENKNIEIVQDKQNNDSIIDFSETEVSEEKDNKPKKEENSIDLDFDLWPADSDIKVSDIFWEENKTEEEINSNSLTDTKEEEISDLDSNFSFNLGESNNNTETVEENIVTEKPEENLSEIDFWINLEDKEELSEIETEDNSTILDDSATWDNDINSILEATIAKLTIRKESIEKIKLETTNKIEELAKEIKELQSEVKAHKNEIKDFDKETDKIEENIESLEKMKMK